MTEEEKPVLVTKDVSVWPVGMEEVDIILVSDEQWNWIQQMLAAPPRDVPKLRELFAKPTVFREGP